MSVYPYGLGYSCSICGAWVPNGTLHNCGGTPTYPTVPPIPVSGWRCPSCGAGIAPFMPHCPFCAPKGDASNDARVEDAPSSPLVGGDRG